MDIVEYIENISCDLPASEQTITAQKFFLGFDGSSNFFENMAIVSYPGPPLTE